MFKASIFQKHIWPCVKFSTGEGSISPEFLRELAAEGRRIAIHAGDLIPPAERNRLISDWALRWRNPHSPWRKKARLLLSESVSLSMPMIEMCLDLFFRSIKRDALRDLQERYSGENSQLVGHILPSNVLAASVESLLFEIIVGNVSIVKASSRSPVFPLLVVETLGDVDHRFRQYVSLVCWKGGESGLEDALVSGVDRLIVYGTQETAGRIKLLAPRHVTLDVYGPGFSVGVIEKEWAKQKDLTALAWKAALDVSIYDQRGCLSLQTIFVEEGGEFSPKEFACALAKALREFEDQYPLGRLTAKEGGMTRSRRNKWLIKELLGEDVFQESDLRGRYTILFEPGLNIDEPLAGRLVTVRPFSNVTELENLFDQHQGVFQGLALTNADRSERWRNKRIIRVAEFGSLHSTMFGWQKSPFSNRAMATHEKA
ncbi:MAG: hypothetical protein HY587_01565 [Candidatus Omnitrophica bacterium]|nr:hypothetical protein [Candidatus Omnitrophota bacterium]